MNKSAAHIAAAICMFAFGLAAVGASASPPNLIVILTEDQGYHDVGFNGSQDIPTPNLDSIASNGVRFASGYVSAALSSPSRASILTGRYPQRFGLERDLPWQPNRPNATLPATETTLAETLSRVGYESGIIGKWHLGIHPSAHPMKRGFNEFFGFLGAGHRYLPEDFTFEDIRKTKSEEDSWRLWVMRNYEYVKTTNYLTDEFSEEATRFISRHKDKPFFLLLAYNAPHAPLQTVEKYASRFPKILGPHRQTYAAMMSAVDDGVGAVLAELRRDGLIEHTLVVYLSANAGTLDANSSDNYPLRGAKNYLWDGGWRVPFAMQWPGQLPKGTVYEQPVSSLDIFATIAALANAPTNPERPLDGVNLVPYLTGQKNGAPHDALFLRMPDRNAYAIRSGKYKLVVPTTNQPVELYDLSKDISELQNIAEQEPEVVRELQQKYADWTRNLMPSGFAEPLETKPREQSAPTPKN